jgi:hypothetical protein
LELARFHEPQPVTDGRETVFIKETSMNPKLVVAAFAALTIAASAAPAAAHGYRHAWGYGGPSFGFGVGWGDTGYGWGGDYADADYGPPWIGVSFGGGPVGWDNDWGYGYRPRYRYSQYAWGYPYDYGYASYPSYASYDCCYADDYGGYYGAPYASVDYGWRSRRVWRGDVGYRFSRGSDVGGRAYNIGRTSGTRTGGTVTRTSVNTRAGGSFGMTRGSAEVSARTGGASVHATGGATVGTGPGRRQH